MERSVKFMRHSLAGLSIKLNAEIKERRDRVNEAAQLLTALSAPEHLTPEGVEEIRGRVESLLRGEKHANRVDRGDVEEGSGVHERITIKP